MNVTDLTSKLRWYIIQQIDTMSVNNPMISFMKPLITRVIDKNFNKVSGLLDLIADNQGNIDIENILTEMTDNIINTNPFTLKTSFIGDIEIGGGQIKLNIPLTDKKLIINTEDINKFRELILKE